jgi:hypothetical protein
VMCAAIASDMFLYALVQLLPPGGAVRAWFPQLMTFMTLFYFALLVITVDSFGRW